MRPPFNAVETKHAAGCDKESSIDRKPWGEQRNSSLNDETAKSSPLVSR